MVKCGYQLLLGLKTLIKAHLFLFCFLFIAAPVIAQEQQTNKDRDSAAQTLRRYIELRLNDADWKEYSKYITWPDEPGWDCKWVVSKYTVGKSKKRMRKIIISVVFTRLGLVCSTPDFKAEKKEVTIKYELEKYSSGWKVSGPEIDYPEIGVNTAIRKLKSLAANGSKSASEREQAEAVVRKIEKVLNQAKAE